MKRLFFVGVALLLLSGTAYAQSSIALGGGYSTGHSDTGDYAVKNGWVGSAQLEDNLPTLSYGKFRSSYGLQYLFINWNREDHKTGTKEVGCEEPNGKFRTNCRECVPDIVETKHDKDRSVDSHFVFGFYRANLDIWSWLTPYALVGLGYEYASDDADGTAGTAAAGLEMQLSKSWSAMAQYQFVRTQDRHFHVPIAMVRYTF